MLSYSLTFSLPRADMFDRFVFDIVSQSVKAQQQSTGGLLPPSRLGNAVIDKWIPVCVAGLASSAYVTGSLHSASAGRLAILFDVDSPFILININDKYGKQLTTRFSF